MIFFTIQNKDYEFDPNEFYEKHERLLLKVAYDILEDRYLAEDAVNQAFCIVLENMHLIPKNNPYKTRAYIVEICRNEAHDIRKGRTYLNNNSDFIDEIEDVYNKDNMDPLEIIINNQLLSSIVRNVKKLKDIYQQALVMKYFVGLPNKVIAKNLKISEQTLRKRLERGRKTVVSKALSETEESK